MSEHCLVKQKVHILMKYLCCAIFNELNRCNLYVVTDYTFGKVLLIFVLRYWYYSSES